MLRLDAAVARFWAATKSKDGNPRPLMPWPREDVEPASPDQVIAFLSSRVKKKD